MARTAPNVVYDWLSTDEVDDAYRIEVEGYPADEAASIEAFRSRQTLAKDLFLGAYLHNESKRILIAYVCSTLSSSPTLTHASMSTHTPAGASVCIHSVCVSPHHRRQSVGLNLLREYIARLEQAPGASYERILLITHEELRPFYEKAGFEWVGKSDVVHGTRPWFEMRKVLNHSAVSSLPAAQESSPELPPGLWEALQRPSRNRPISKPLSAFSGGITDVIVASSHESGVSTNKYDLICPREGCGSLILRHGAAQWVERASVQMEPPNLARSPVLSALPPPPETTQWWLVGPSPMAFENIGFSKPVQSLSQDITQPGKKLKLLACAECDLGPLGWSHEGGTEFWLACVRVGYR